MPTRRGVILPYDCDPFVVLTAYSMMVTMCLCVLTRFVATFMAARNFRMDDYFIIIATVTSYPRGYSVYCF